MGRKPNAVARVQERTAPQARVDAGTQAMAVAMDVVVEPAFAAAGDGSAAFRAFASAYDAMVARDFPRLSDGARLQALQNAWCKLSAAQRARYAGGSGAGGFVAAAGVVAAGPLAPSA